MQNWVNFAEIKCSVPLAPLVRQYRVQLRRSGRDQYRGCCPIHGGQGRDAFHVNLTKNVFHCFACGARGTVLDFVAAMERCSLREAALKLARAKTGTAQPATGCPTQLVTEKSKPLPPLGFALRGIDSTHPYLAKRGIETCTAERFGIGFYRGAGIFSGRLVIPIHNEDGQLVAYCGRAVDATEPRYRFPSGFAKSKVVFNLHRALEAGKQSVVLVEGFFDCMKLHQAGVHSAVALMGSVLYALPQRALLQRFQRVVLMLDGDAAGRRATADIAAQLRAYCSVGIVRLPEQRQPDQMSADEIRRALTLSRTADFMGPVQ
jgi:DNA primase